MPPVITSFATPVSLQLLETMVARVPLEQAPALFQHTLRLADLSRQGLGYEQAVLQSALASPLEAERDRALGLYRRPSRLFYHIASHAEKIRQALGVDVGELPEPVARREDLIAQSAWARFGGGAMTILDMGTLYDPVGDMSGGINYFLDRQGLHLHWEGRRGEEPGWMPPPAFGFVSRESPARIEKYNRGQFERLGDVAFDFPDESQMVVLPHVYRDLLRENLPFQVVIPAANELDKHFTPAWAAKLRDETVILSAIKGLPKGRTPLEHFRAVLETAGKADAVSVIDFLGLAPSRKFIRQQRALRAGQLQEIDPLKIVLATRRKRDGVELAKRYCGPEAVHRTEEHGGAFYDVVENAALQPPVKALVLSDPDMIRASELASIFKNERAIDLGRMLLERMVEEVDKGRRWDSVLHREFTSFYDRLMEEAREDIQKVLELEGIPEAKRVLIEDVQNDLDGSWMITEFRSLYDLVRRVFDQKSPQEDWEEAMVLLKLRLLDFYAVRNPCFGFGLAATREVARRGRWLNRPRLQETVKRLREKKPPLITEEEAVSLLKPQEETHTTFTMIPSGLWPEGMQIAENLPKRYPGLMEQLPERMQKAHLFVQRQQEDSLFDPETYMEVVNLSAEMGLLFPGDAGSGRKEYAKLLMRLLDLMERGRNLIKSRPRIYPINGAGFRILMRVMGHLRAVAKNIEENDALTERDIALVNQAMVEVLTEANLFNILTPEENQKEAKFLMASWERLRTYTDKRKGGGASSGRNCSDLFASASPGVFVDPEVAKGLLGMRGTLQEHASRRLIELTRDMNRRFYRKDRAVNKGHVVETLEEIRELIQATNDLPNAQQYVLAGIAGSIDTLIEALGSAELKADPLTGQKVDPELLVYQAVIQTLIHSRRFLVFPDEAAPLEFSYTFERFNKILRFIQGNAESPLWHFGNGHSHPPPAGAE